MKLKIWLSLAIIALCSSCHGQPGKQTINNHVVGEGSVVTELGNNIMLVYQDQKNNYWFGSWEDGLYLYDGKIIRHYTTQNGLPSNRVDEIKEDGSGNMYFNTSGGIIQYDGKNFTRLKVSDSDGNWKLERDDIWFKDGLNSGFVYRYDGNILYKLSLPKIKDGEDYMLKNPNNANPYAVYSIYKDSKGNVWFGTGALGAFRYNGNTFDWIVENDVAEIYNDPSEPSNGVRSIIEDKEGYFWFNSKFRYKIYDSYTYSIKNYKTIFYDREKSVGSLDGKNEGNLFEYLSITKDNNNELWIATYNAGVWRYDGEKITHYIVQDRGKDITLFSIYKDNNGNLWLGTQNNGAFKFNGKSFEKFKI